MRQLARLRQWINRDDGRHYQIGNRSIGACEATGHLAIIAAAVLWLLHAQTGLSSYWACAAIALGILLFAVSGLLDHKRNTPKNPPAQSDEESPQPPQSH